MEPAPPAADHSGILSALRAATGEAHQQLEDVVAIERRVADPAQYRRLLQTFLGFYRPLETHLAALPGWGTHGIDFAARRKTPWLESDLRALGFTDLQIAALPDCPHLPPADSLTSGFGCLYVLEGATLGGRHISSMLRESPVPGDARHFFNSYGAATGERWREFLAALESLSVALRETDRAETVRAARETFTCLHGWFVRECLAHEYPG